MAVPKNSKEFNFKLGQHLARTVHELNKSNINLVFSLEMVFAASTTVFSVSISDTMSSILAPASTATT